MDPNFRALAELARIHNERETAAFPRLADLLVQFRWSSASDARDKVYGLLGLVTADDRQLPDFGQTDLYNTSVTKCYTLVTFDLLKRSQDLTLLVHCSTPTFIVRDQTLPSWVPEWQYDMEKLPPPPWRAKRTNPYHRRSDIRSVVYRGYRASGDSQLPDVELRNGRILALHGKTVGRLATVCRPIGYLHQTVHAETPRGMLRPRVPASQLEHITSQFWSLDITALTSVAVIVVHNFLRRGAGVEILLEYSALANSNDTWLGDDARPRDPLHVMFDTLTLGRRGRDTIQSRFSDTPGEDMVHKATRELRAQHRWLRWNHVLQLLGLPAIRTHFPTVYYFFVGWNYFYWSRVPV